MTILYYSTTFIHETTFVSNMMNFILVLEVISLLDVKGPSRRLLIYLKVLSRL